MGAVTIRLANSSTPSGASLTTLQWGVSKGTAAGRQYLAHLLYKALTRLSSKIPRSHRYEGVRPPSLTQHPTASPRSICPTRCRKFKLSFYYKTIHPVKHSRNR